MSHKPLGPAALLEAAAALMDEHGIDEVTDGQIVEASGHRNNSAVKYHFGSRDELVRAVIVKTMEEVNVERNALLDHLGSVGSEMTVRTALEVLVGPLARRLRTSEGRRYLRLCAQVLDHPRFNRERHDIPSVNAGYNSSIVRCAALLRPHMAHLPDPVMAERASQAIAFAVRACADQAYLLDSEPAPRPRLGMEDFVVNLIDTLLAMLFAPSTVRSHRPPVADGTPDLSRQT